MAKTMIHVYLTTDEKDALQKAAEKERRPLSGFVLLAGLARAKVTHGIEPSKKD